MSFDINISAQNCICRDCPRECGVQRSLSRSGGEFGYCGMPQTPVLARAMLHQWEEPCLSGERGAGTVFFSGCNLGCVYCQNYQISHDNCGEEVSVARLADIFCELQQQGAHNIDLVNPSHYSQAVLQALDLLERQGRPLDIPIVWNSGGYDSIATLQRMEGRVQVYLPDLKYMDSGLSQRYSAAADYPERAAAAIHEMFRQRGPYQLDDDGMLQSGVMIRHLLLPGQLDNTFDVLDWVAENFRRGEVLLSLMSQYTPAGRAADFPELNRKLPAEEYQRAVDYMWGLGIEDGYVQDGAAASEQFIPDFDGRGI